MAYATTDEVEANLGRPLSDTERAQATLWIGWAEAEISARMGDLDALDQAILTMVIVEAVTVRLRNPEAVTQVAVQIDDGRMERRYQKSTGLIEIRPEWWARLGWVDAVGAFTVTPHGTPDATAAVDNAWW